LISTHHVLLLFLQLCRGQIRNAPELAPYIPLLRLGGGVVRRVCVVWKRLVLVGVLVRPRSVGCVGSVLDLAIHFPICGVVIEAGFAFGYVLVGGLNVACEIAI
jgi:hypothetical protein